MQIYFVLAGQCFFIFLSINCSTLLSMQHLAMNASPNLTRY
ncbi:putative membrane protein [Acinetobacter sp. 1000160]|nr:putative membrane protein [Acinetobacter sp. 1000160]